MSSDVVPTPILVILGATGAGKSQLALELAHKFGGEIISADAMQMYKGLDIVTNKVTDEEQQLVKHHMINILDPLCHNNVVDFRNKSLPVIEKLLSENKIPVICGGTNYYIESLLFKILVDEDLPLIVGGKRVIDDIIAADNQVTNSDPNQYENCDSLRINDVDWSNDDGSIPTRLLYSTLQSVDPDRGSVLHPKERRKIWRSLQVFARTGTTHSQLLHSKEGDSESGFCGGLRFDISRICVIEVWSEQEVLEQRCNKRVDKMMKRGLVKELQDFHENYNKLRAQSGNLDSLHYHKGIWQSIGFKEFHNYLLLSDEARKSAEGQTLFDECVERMKISTRQYSRRQAKWIRRRFLTNIRDSPPVYRVDSSDPSLWSQNVYQPAEAIVQHYLSGTSPDMEPLPRICEDPERDVDYRKTLHCDVCDRDFKGECQFRNHQNSKSHKKAVRALGNNYVYETWLLGYNKEERLNVSKMLKNIFSIGLADAMSKLDNIPVLISQERSEIKSKKIVTQLMKNNIQAEVRKVTQENVS